MAGSENWWLGGVDTPLTGRYNLWPRGELAAGRAGRRDSFDGSRGPEDALDKLIEN